MYLIAYLFILSIILLIVALNNIFGSARVKKLEKELYSIKNHEKRHSKEQIRLLNKLLKVLEKSHPKIFEEIANENINNTVVDNDKQGSCRA
jgi:hypothetical protein